ncbi:YbaB/EbfC family DNA-binding protein [Micromonospora sp. NPDC049497]|uniref:YbaB/EbfC family DNA-binding protein n=1 Tax=Micromonospora sp. NPDC049497 TaxID=3364273 RepID=UPI0037988B23
MTALDALLYETQQALEFARSRHQNGEPAPDDEQVVGHGEALDGLVCAGVRGGRIEELNAHPRVMRLPVQDLMEHIKTAVNAAFDDLQSRHAPDEPTVDLDSLAGGLRDVQDRSLRQMAQMNTALQDVVALLREPRR